MKRTTQVFNKKITHCIYCKSTILWNRYGDPLIVKYGNNQVFECMQEGCGLIIVRIPDASTSEELGSFLLTLIRDGIPADVAQSAALRLINDRVAA